MKQSASSQKTTQQPDHSFRADTAAGPNGIAIAPPVYGIEVVDRKGSLERPDSPASPLIQPKLIVTPPGDPYEQEADRVAAQVVQQLQAPTPAQAPPGAAVQRQATVNRPGPVQSLLQRRGAMAGGEAAPEVTSTINRARGGGQPLETGLQQRMGEAMGADFSRVRVHTDTRAAQLNQTLQAQAFTTGQDLFFRAGAYQPKSQGGQTLIAHELAHVVQQRGGDVQRAPQVEESSDTTIAPTTVPTSNGMNELIQRDIGFEFETRNVYTKKSRRRHLPGQFNDDQEAVTAWNNGTRIKKGGVLLRGEYLEIQADDHSSKDESDLEVVTTHFPLTPPGRIQLGNAMTNLINLVTEYDGLRQRDIVTARALNRRANFRTVMDKGMFKGDWSTATTSPQITFGTRLQNIADIVRDLHDEPGETIPQQVARAPGRLKMRRPMDGNVNKPVDLGPIDEAQILIRGRELAQGAIRAYQVYHPGAPAGPELEGFLTIIFTYCEGVPYKWNFLKQHTPLIAKTDLATIFMTLPRDVQTHYSQRQLGEKTNLEQLVERSPGYAAKMNQSLFLAGRTLNDEDNRPGRTSQWYHQLTLQSWLRELVLQGRRNRRGKDQLSNKKFPRKPPWRKVEGYAALRSHMDTHTDANANRTQLPIFELRSASKRITYAETRQWALDLFDYIRSLNDNLGVGHQLIT